MKSNLRKSSLLLFCAMFFVFAFFASPGLADPAISVDGTGKTYPAISVDVQTIGKTSTDFSPDYRGVVAVNGGSVDITEELKVTTTGDNSDALNALNGGKIKAGSADITTSGNTAVAVYAKSETQGVFSSVDIAGHAKITTNNTTNSVYADDNSEISFGSLELTMNNNENGVALQANAGSTDINFSGGVIKVAGDAVVKTSGENAVGLFANRRGNISIGGLATVTTSGKDAHGMQIRSWKESSISVGSANISTDGEEANGIYLSLGTVSVNNAAVIDTSGVSADSLYVDRGVFKAGSLQAQTHGNNALGIHSTGGGASVDITGLAKLTTSGDQSYGMAATGGGVITAGSADVTTSGEWSHGIYSGGTSDDLRSTVDIKGLAKVTTASKDSYGMWAAEKGVIKVDSAEISTNGVAGFGIASSNLASVDITGLAKVTTLGQYGQGLRAENGGAITAGSAEVTTSGDTAHGIWSWGISDDQRASVNITGLANVSTSGSGAYGLYAQDGGAIAAGSADVTTRGSGAYGIWSSGVSDDQRASVDIKGQAKVLTLGSTQYGLYAESGDITVGGLADVSVANGSNAVYAENGSIIKLNGGASLDVTGDGTGYNYVNGIGVADNGNVFVTGDKAVIKATANGSKGNAYAVYSDGGSVSVDVTGNIEFTASAQNGSASAVNGSNITLKAGGQASFDVTGLSASGLYKQDSGQNITVDAAGGSNYKVTATSGDAYGLEAKGTGNILEYGKVNNVVVEAAKGDAYGLAALNGAALSGDAANNIKNITVTEKTADKAAYGVYVYDGSSVTGASIDKLTVNSAGDAYGIAALNGGSVSGDVKNISVTAKTADKTAYGILVSGDKSSAKLGSIDSITVNSAGKGYGLYAGGSSDVSGTINNITVSASGDAYGIYAPDANTSLDVKVTGVIKAVSETGEASSIYSKAGVITTEAHDAQIFGDVVAKNGSKQALNLNNSSLTGAISADKGNGTKVDLDVKDSTSVWNVTDTSNTGGTLNNNGGTVKFYGNDGDNKNLYHKVTVGTLSGTGGKYLMHADVESGKGDQIVADNSNVNGVIEIVSPKKFGIYRKRMSDDLVIVNNDKHSSFTLANNGGYYEYGSWQYVLASEDIDGSALAGTSGLATLAANGGGLGWYLLNTQQVSSTATAVFDSLMAPTIGHLEEGALYSQLGDQDWIASGDRTHVWGYAVYSKFKYTGHVTTPLEGSIDGDNYAENKYYGLTGGIDKVVYECDKGTLRLGAMMGYGEGDLDMDNGDASDNSFHAGVYGVYRFNSGLYLAGIAKYNRYRTDVTARPIEGGSYEASYNQDGFGISALAGKRFELRNSWYVEPQAELGWARIGSASYTINNSDVEIDSTNSVRGRLGFALGRRVATETGKTLDFYVKASVIREFDGETDLTMSGDPFKADFGGTWGQYKLGVNYWNNDNFMLHGALVYENGENYESPIGVELGLNWFTGPKPQKDEAEATITE